jgi:hypothetical protein
MSTPERAPAPADAATWPGHDSPIAYTGGTATEAERGTPPTVVRGRTPQHSIKVAPLVHKLFKWVADCSAHRKYIDLKLENETRATGLILLTCLEAFGFRSLDAAGESFEHSLDPAHNRFERLQAGVHLHVQSAEQRAAAARDDAKAAHDDAKAARIELEKHRETSERTAQLRAASSATEVLELKDELQGVKDELDRESERADGAESELDKLSHELDDCRAAAHTATTVTKQQAAGLAQLQQRLLQAEEQTLEMRMLASTQASQIETLHSTVRSEQTKRGIAETTLKRAGTKLARCDELVGLERREAARKKELEDARVTVGELRM